MLPPLYLWQKAPFLRLLPPLSLGILCQWYHPLPGQVLLVMSAVAFAQLAVSCLLSARKVYRLLLLNGLCFQLLVFGAGALLTRSRDLRPRLRQAIQGKAFRLLRLEEDPVEKPRSFRALATLETVAKGRMIAESRLVLYFSKEAPARKLSRGSLLLAYVGLEPVRHTGNPGAFDYRQYCLFQGILYQAYLPAQAFRTLSGPEPPGWISRLQGLILRRLKAGIPGEREAGLAEALLIGYRNDLDPDLVQAYTRTGVVHVIAISGMHLALVYGLLLFATRWLHRWRWPRFLLLLAGLWGFCFLAGAGPSVLRSSVMFTCLALGSLLNRKSPVINRLALSAFLLLWYDPFLLWDAGFQLSYAAVLGIVLYYRPIAAWAYFPNPLLDGIWKSMALSLSAQVLTTPISLFHFHQFPLLFLLTNLVAVPLSSLLVLGEILLCLLASWEAPFHALGWALEQAIRMLNHYIERLERVSFGLWEGICLSLPQAWLLMLCFLFFCGALLQGSLRFLYLSLAAALVIVCLRYHSFSVANRQAALVVYNIPRQSAAALIWGRTAEYILPDSLLPPSFSSYAASSSLRFRTRDVRSHKAGARASFCGRTIFFTGTTHTCGAEDLSCDYLILSGNVPPPSVPEGFAARARVVLDNSVPRNRAGQWKALCLRLKIPCFDLRENGAFVVQF